MTVWLDQQQIDGVFCDLPKEEKNVAGYVEIIGNYKRFTTLRVIETPLYLAFYFN